MSLLILEIARDLGYDGDGGPEDSAMACVLEAVSDTAPNGQVLAVTKEAALRRKADAA